MKKMQRKKFAAFIIAVLTIVSVLGETPALMTQAADSQTTEQTQTLPNSFLDLSEGLKADVDYNGITFGEDFPVNASGQAIEFSLNDITYTSAYIVQGTSNVAGAPGSKTAAEAESNIGVTGGLPTSGAYTKIVPKTDGVFTVVIKQNGVKPVYFAEETSSGTLTIKDGFSTVADEIIVKNYEVTAGKTYYFYAIGSKPMIAGIGIVYGVPDYFLDLENGVKTGIDYDGISFGEDFPVNASGQAIEFSLDDTTYTSAYIVQGTSNVAGAPGSKTAAEAESNIGVTGGLPTSGAYTKIVPKANGVFTVVINQNGVKPVYFAEETSSGTLTIKDGFPTVADEIIVKNYEVTAGKTYYFYAIGSKPMIAGIGIKYEPDTTIAVTDITGIADEMTIGEPLTLAGTVTPDDATNKTIIWSIEDAGNTGATIKDNQLTATTAGTIIVKATIEKGKSLTEDYTQSFAIEVKSSVIDDTMVAVTNITGVAVEMKVNETITLDAIVVPDEATNKTIVWSIKDAGDTGATLDGNKLTATTAGAIIVTATIEQGISATEDYTQDFTIKVKDETTVKLGDVNGDTKIDSIDALAVLKYDVGIEQDDFIEAAADVNNDQKIDSLDALEILKYDVGLIEIQ